MVMTPKNNNPFALFDPIPVKEPKDDKEPREPRPYRSKFDALLPTVFNDPPKVEVKTPTPTVKPNEPKQKLDPVSNTPIPQTPNPDIAPNSDIENVVDNRIKNFITAVKMELQKLNAEQRRVQMLMNALMVSQNNPIYYSSFQIISYIKEKLKISYIPNRLLNSIENQRKYLPNYHILKDEEKELLVFLSRCIRDGRAFERYNDFQLKLWNEKMEMPQKSPPTTD